MTKLSERHDELLERVGQLETAIDLAIELLHDQHAWMTAAFQALGVTVTCENPPPRQGTVLRLIQGFRGHKKPDADGAA